MYLCSALGLVGGQALSCEANEPEPTDLDKIPKLYHFLQEVLSKNKVLSLPPHRPYNCAIDLLLGAPLPTISAAFESLQGASVFSKLDLHNTYHLDEWKAAFSNPMGHFECLALPSGITNTPTVFQMLVNDLL